MNLDDITLAYASEEELRAVFHVPPEKEILGISWDADDQHWYAALTDRTEAPTVGGHE